MICSSNCPGWGVRLLDGLEAAVARRQEHVAREPELDPNVRLGEAVGDDPPLGLATELRDDHGIDDPIARHDGAPGAHGARALGDQDHVLGDASSARREVVVLLLVEVRTRGD